MMKLLVKKNVALYGLYSLALLTLSGCVTLKSDTPPPAIYRIEPSAISAPIELDVPAPTILLVNEPIMPAGFVGSDMTLHFDGGRRQDRYAGALWADELSDMIRQLAVAQGRATYPDLVLDTAQFGLSPDYTLNIDVLDFQPVYEGEPSGVPLLKTRARFALMNAKTGALLADMILERINLAESNNLTSITSGLESQLQDILAEAYESIAPQIR
jgi:ABC-type uncharacterized transport system auxiliary subunit